MDTFFQIKINYSVLVLLVYYFHFGVYITVATNCQFDSDCLNHTVTDSVCISGVCACQSGDQLVDNACLYDCGNPDTPGNGTVSWTQNETLQGDVVIYGCNPGYKLIGYEESNCTRAGWGALPSCEFGCLSDEDCTEVTNSTCNTTTYECICPKNFVVYFNKCVYDCGDPPEFFVGGTVLPRAYLGTREGDIVIYYCPSNYKMFGSDQGNCEIGGWSGMQPLCLYDCGPLPNIANGNIILDTPDNTTEGATATVICDNGYKESTTRITCLDTGQWEDAECIVDCGNPEVPTNGSVFFMENGTLLGDVATYSCDIGYKLIGNREVNCTSVGWETTPTCEFGCLSDEDCAEVDNTTCNTTTYECICQENFVAFSNSLCLYDCGNPPAIFVNGTALSSELLYLYDTEFGTLEGDYVAYSCPSKYNMYGSSFGICEIGGWSGMQPQCLYDCGPLPNITNGNIILDTPDNTTERETATVICDNGYKESTTRITCLDTGQWEDAECIVDCGNPEVPTNGSVFFMENGTFLGDVATYSCDIGYTLIGNKEVICTSAGWETTPICEFDCGPLPNITNGNIILDTPDNTTERATATVICDNGYKENCGNPEIPTNGSVFLMENGTLLGDVATYSCDIGYKLIGNKEVNCTSAGWETTPTCEYGCLSDADCTKNNYTTCNTTIYGCICQENFVAYSDSLCLYDCGNPPEFSVDGIALSWDFLYFLGTELGTLEGDSIVYRCPPNYTMSGSDIGICEVGGWSEIQPLCLYDCGTPEVLTNGSVFLLENGTLQGDVATYSCDNGYKLIGNKEVNCTSAGWGTKPTCEFSCLSDEDCTEVTNTTCNTTIYECICQENFVAYTDSLCLYDCGNPPDFFVDGAALPRSILYSYIFLRSVEGSLAVYNCPSNYTMYGSDILTCEVGGWTGMQPLCLYDCGPLPNITNGNIFLDTPDNTTERTTATVICDNGYKESTTSIACLDTGQWDDAECIVDCGPPLIIPNGNITLEQPDKTTEGASATVTCDDGFKETALNITCLDTGQWEDVKCIVDCGPPNIIPNGNITLEQPNNTTEGASATVTCDDGFKESAISITCLETRQWEDVRCIVDCGPLKMIPNGNITLDQPDNTTEGASATLTCDDGFKESAGSITCLETGQWEDVKCIVDCGPPKIILNGNISLVQTDNTTEGASATLECHDGFKESAINITCLETGQWEDVKCVVDCGPPKIISYGNITLDQPDNTTEGASATVTCDDGFKESAESIMCLETGQWEDVKCIVDCGPPKIILNGNITLVQPDNTTEGASATVECDDGFKESTINITCLETGQWVDVKCIVDCGPPKIILNGNITLVQPDNTTEGASATVECHDGFKESAINITCLETGQWEDVKCVVDCGPPKITLNGNITLDQPENTTEGALATVTCDDGFKESAGSTTCLETRKWEDVKCIVDCGLPKIISYGNITLDQPDNTTERASATVSCDDGFKENVGNITCLETGQWEDAKCIVDCGPPKIILNGNITLKQPDNTTEGASATVNCDDGFKESAINITCLETGQWEDVKCIVDCGPPKIIPNGNITLDQPDNTTEGASATVTCDDGFKESAESIMCLETGQWEDVKCIVDCGQPKIVLNGNITLEQPDNTTEGASATATCDEGFRESAINITCLETGQWEDVKCIVDCGPPKIIPNGNITLDQPDNTTEGASATVTCDDGFKESAISITCLETRQWEDVKCIVDCGPTLSIPKANITLEQPDNTTVGATATVTCVDGFKESAVSMTCLETGEWEHVECIVECNLLKDPPNGTTDISNGTVFNALASYSCFDGFTLVGDKTRVCQENGMWSGMEPVCAKPGYTKCSNETDWRGTFWQEVISAKTRTYICGQGFKGINSRQCKEDGTWDLPQYGCMREAITVVKEQIELLDDNATQEDFLSVLNELEKITQQNETTSQTEKLTDGEIIGMVESVAKISQLLNSSSDILSDGIADAFIGSVNNLVDTTNFDSWRSISQTGGSVAETVLKAVDDIGDALGKFVASGGVLAPIIKNNIGLQVNKLSTANQFNFPDQDVKSNSINNNAEWLSSTKSKVQFNPAAFQDTSVQYVAIAAIYKNLSQILPDQSEKEKLNGQIVTFSTIPPFTEAIDPPIKLTFEHANTEWTKPTCSFWKFQTDSPGNWSSEGCNASSLQSGVTECECNHFTNFAVLLSLQDCGSLEEPSNGKIESTVTTYNSTAKFRCDNGYSINGSNTAVCQFNGSWSSKQPKCLPKDCGPLENPSNGEVNTSSGTTLNARAVYVCADGFELEGSKQRLCLANGSWSLPVPACTQEEQNVLKCLADEDSRGFTWETTQAGNVINEPCDDGFTGYKTRKCQTDGTWQLPHYNCVRESVQEVNEKVSALTANSTEDDVSKILKEMTQVTVQNETGRTEEKITDGELSTLTSSLDKVADVLATNTKILNNNTADSFIETASSLIDNSNQESWKSLSESESNEAAKVLKAVDKMTEALSKNIKSSGEDQKVIIVKKNVALEVKKFQRESVVFPNTDVSDKGQDEWIEESQSSLQLNSEALKNDSVEYVTTAVMYRDMSEILPTKDTDASNETSSEDTVEEESDEDIIINAPILALSIFPPVYGKLVPPVKLTFQHNVKNLTTPSCVFWKFPSESTGVGYWSTDDCKVSTTNETFTVCECEHLTNFAILMSPFVEADASSQVLRIISVVGIGVSLACLIATFCVYLYLWKYLRNDHTTVLMNLCVALIISYIIFLGGADRTESTAACTAIAAILHYIFLVVFCVMLVEGIEIAITVLYVFKRKWSRIKLMLIIAWVCPAVIVGTSLGVTKLEGYGNENYCWLSVEDGLIWAFVGPVLLVIALNVICLAIVIYTMFQTKSMETKKTLEKIKTSFRSLCVLVPVMGICWILGIFYVNDSFYFIQYIFAILNGLQGFFIFLFHCLLNAQVKKALKILQERRRRSTLRTTLKSTSRSATKEDKLSKDLRETGRSYLESSGEFVKDTSDDWKDKILQPQLSQDVVKFSTPLRFSGNGRLAASFSAEARDQLIGDTTKPISEQPEKLSERLQSQLLSARL